MKVKISLVVAVAVILLYAIHLGRGVRLEVALPGAGGSLEVTGQSTSHTEAIETASGGERKGATTPPLRSE